MVLGMVKIGQTFGGSLPSPFLETARKWARADFRGAQFFCERNSCFGVFEESIRARVSNQLVEK